MTKKLLAAIAAVGLVAWMLPTSASAAWSGTSIVGSPHDFSLTTNNAGAHRDAADTVDMDDQICIYCHTPHHANSTLLLWNHTRSSSTFTWTDTSVTTGGTTLPSLNGGTYAGQSVKCLSCHDGTVAVGSVYFDQEVFNPNAPTGILMTGTELNGATGKINSGSAFLIGSGGTMDGNHPVAVPYPYNNSLATYNGIGTGSSVNLTEWKATPANVKIYKSVGQGGPSTGDAGIECSSCHDPHKNVTGGDLFLRDVMTQSAICLDCHSK